jgi:2-polyprenyl-6-methoxyphenol hydroxylase-like FAD-dependent oxidoreductase
MLGQDDNERIMGARLAELGVSVQWQTELVSFEQQLTHVDAALKLPDGNLRTIKAGWLAGCDGSRSSVREKSGIGFPGSPYEHTFFVADTEATGPMKPDEVNVYLSRDGFHLFFPMRGQDRWRVIGILPDQLRRRDEVKFEEVVPSMREEAGVALSFKSCGWFSTYRIHHRAAERFRDRRCFLLGDAAHIHSPMGGQGMNTGLQDAHNLAWKLALVITGAAIPQLLDTYEQERMPVAQQLLKTTDRAFQLVVADNWIATLLRTRLIGKIAARAMTFDRVRKRAFNTLSQIGIRYPQSALSHALAGLPRGAPQAGDRFPWLQLRIKASGPIEDLFQNLDDRYFNLLVFVQPNEAVGALSSFGNEVRVHVIPADETNVTELAGAKIPVPSFYLLRPDGHTALCGAQLEISSIERYLARWLRFDKSGVQSEAVAIRSR